MLIDEVVQTLPEEDKRRLRQALRLQSDAQIAEIEDALRPFANAALAEYIDQLTGRQLPSRIKDVEQLRLLYMTRFVFGGRLPDPDTVAELFQKSFPEAKTLLRNTATRYRFELADDMNAAAWAVIVDRSQPAGRNMDPAKDAWNVEVRDLALLEYIHDAVRRGEGNPSPVKPSGSEMHVYLFEPSAIKALLQVIGRTWDDFLEAKRGA